MKLHIMASAQKYQGDSNQGYFPKRPVQGFSSLLSLLSLLFNRNHELYSYFIKLIRIKISDLSKIKGRQEWRKKQIILRLN
jgi:hypothetical protein